ncbi:hypothetical protein FPZ24_08255 [Sphingomonas panacisoli]|uniref:Uncharacterized protein n=1 Tax=Sphingomonas panacisoli TaxID=1813879 RepID=A0A5B8LI16_9SPHN|nr:hypothetical protein [Sphingomonas panacisoli]QDZ07475.1 hypothetical protein FPZ24_08255 [Sphingomonas panacisoli]
MAQDGNVVPKVEPRTEEDFRNTWLQALSRLCKDHTDAKVALWLGIGIDHLRKNVKSGISLPTADKIWNLLAYDASAHDELDKAFGVKNVPENALCSTDPLTRDMIALANETAQDEDPASPGGIVTTDHELLKKDEARLRRVHRTLTSWLNRIEQLRAPRLREVA